MHLSAQYDAAIPGGAQDPTSASLVIRFGSVEHSCTCVSLYQTVLTRQDNHHVESAYAH